MSQHIFSTTVESEPIVVVGGWDRPTQEAFMMIEDDRGDPIYHSDIDKLKGDTGIEFFKAKLLEMKVSVPLSFFEQIEADQQNNAGNRFCVYEQNGTFTSR